MVAVASELVRTREELTPADVGAGEPVTDRFTSLAAITGALGGAVTGALLGAAAGMESPGPGGVLGAAIGSALVTGVWCGIARAWLAIRAGRGSEDGLAHPIAQCRIR